MTDPFAGIATQIHLELFTAFVEALGPEDRYSTDEPDGVAQIKGPGGEMHELRRDTLRVVAGELVRLREDPDPAAEYGGDLTAPLCCCKRGSMCAECGTGRHWQCPDRDDSDDEPDTAGGWFCNNSNCDCREDHDDD